MRLDLMLLAGLAIFMALVAVVLAWIRVRLNHETDCTDVCRIIEGVVIVLLLLIGTCVCVALGV